MASLTDTLRELLTLDGALCAAVVDSDSGMMLAEAGTGLDLEIASAGNTEVMRAKLRTIKAPSDLPGTSLEFRVAAREAAGLVTKTAMMPTDKKPPTNKHVTLRPAYLSRRVSWGDGILYPLDLT